MNRKRILFYLILAAPALMLSGLFVLAGRDLHAIRTVDPAAVARDLRDHLDNKEPESFPFPDDFAGRTGASRMLFAFGASSLVISDGMTFPDYLGRRPGLQVVNFGVSGIDSFSVRQRVEEALSVASPDIILLYYGHNDYNNAYNGLIVPEYFERFDALIALPYLFHDKDRPEGVILSDDWYWYSRLMRPRIIKAFEQLRLLRLRSSDYGPVNSLILESFRRNHEAIIALARSRRIPMVLVTPVGNLHAEPFGDLATTTALYRRGMAEPDYSRSLALLKQARDAEFLTYDIRAKSSLLDVIRSSAGPGVYVLDLERELEQRRFGFGYGDFLDYFHFNDRSHRLVAEIIDAFLVRHGLVRQPLGAPVNGAEQPLKARRADLPGHFPLH